MKVTCVQCRQRFETSRRTTKYCSPTCRQRAARGRKSGRASGSRRSFKFVAATRRELEQLGKADSMLGLQVLAVARRMENDAESGAAMAALSKEHSRLMAMLAAGDTGDPVDALRERRNAKAREAAG